MKKKLSILIVFTALFANSQTKLKLSQIEYAPSAGYVPYTDANGKLTYSLLATVSPTISLNNSYIAYGSSSNTLTGSSALTYSNNVLNLSTTVTPYGGYNTDSDPILTIARTTNSTTSSNSHGFVDATHFIKNSNGWANNAYTDNSDIFGTANYDHHAAFQNAFKYYGSGFLNKSYGFVDIPFFNSGTTTDRYGFYPFDATGTGTVTNNYGLYVPSLTRGTSTNYAIYTAGSTPSMFNGSVINNSNFKVTGGTYVGARSSAYMFSHGTPTLLDLSKIEDELQSGYTKMIFSVANSFSPTYVEPLVLDGSTNKATVQNLNVNTLNSNSLVYSDANKDIKPLSLGNGLSLTSGTLSATNTSSTTVLTASTNITISGSAPNYTISTPTQTTGLLVASNNLSDISSPTTARNNLKEWNLFLTGGDQSTTSNVAANITDLVSPTLTANKRYQIHGRIRNGCNNTGGVKYQITIPAGASLYVYFSGSNSSNTTYSNSFVNASATLMTVVLQAFNGTSVTRVDGEITLGATAGTVQFGFASNTNTQTSTVYQQGTSITIKQLN